MKHLHFRSLIALVLGSSLVLPGIAKAVIIEAGKDYLHTVSASFDFGGQIGVVEFKGGNVGPENTDTIVERLEDTIDLNPGDMDTIDIKMIELSLHSIDPVDIGGTFFDVWVGLDPVLMTTGTMKITLNNPPDGTNAPEGTFDSVLNLNLDALFQEIGNPGNSFIVDITETLTATAIPWSTEYTDPWGRIGPREQPFWDEGPNFFPVGFPPDGIVPHEAPGHIHIVEIAGTPEIDAASGLSALTLLFGVFGLMGERFRRRQTSLTG